MWYTIYGTTKDGVEHLIYDCKTRIDRVRYWIDTCGKNYERVRVFKGKNIGRLIIDTKQNDF